MARSVKLSHQLKPEGRFAKSCRPAPPSARALLALSLLQELGSLTAAAIRLGVTRSALSHRIAELERSLGAELTRKAGR